MTAVPGPAQRREGVRRPTAAGSGCGFDHPADALLRTSSAAATGRRRRRGLVRNADGAGKLEPTQLLGLQRMAAVAIKSSAFKRTRAAKLAFSGRLLDRFLFNQSESAGCGLSTASTHLQLDAVELILTTLDKTLLRT